MIMRDCAVLATIIVCICAGQASAQQAPRQKPKFEDHRTTLYRGPVAAPDFTGQGRVWSSYRTRIRDGMRGGVNFAGNLALIEIGCGTGCRFVIAANIQTGKLSSFPLGGEDNTGLNLDYLTDSSLVITHWQNEDRCTRQSFVWTGSNFRQIDVADVGSATECHRFGRPAY